MVVKGGVGFASKQAKLRGFLPWLPRWDYFKTSKTKSNTIEKGPWPRASKQAKLRGVEEAIGGNNLLQNKQN